MDKRFLILLRLFQSRPGGGVRLVDTRYAHEFGESVVICDTEVLTLALNPTYNRDSNLKLDYFL